MHILFVCTGNTCRSPMCEAYFTRLLEQAGISDVTVSSAGLFAGGGMPASHGSVTIMRDFDIDLSSFRNVQLDESILEQADLVVAMSTSHRAHIGAMNPDALDKTRLLLEFADQPETDVPDPFGGAKQVYRNCFEEMKKALDNLLLELDRLK